MAIFIPKNRLGSGSSSTYERRLKERIESTPGFKALRSQLATAKEQRKEALSGKWDDNAEVQRWKTLTKEEQARDAIERMVPTTKVLQEQKTGKECSYEDARKVAETIAYKKDAKDAEK